MEDDVEQMAKSIAKKSYIEGYKNGQDIENNSDVSIRSAKTSFEQWWSNNMEQLKREKGESFE